MPLLDSIIFKKSKVLQQVWSNNSFKTWEREIHMFNSDLKLINTEDKNMDASAFKSSPTKAEKN